MNFQKNFINEKGVQTYPETLKIPYSTVREQTNNERKKTNILTSKIELGNLHLFLFRQKMAANLILNLQPIVKYSQWGKSMVAIRAGWVMTGFTIPPMKKIFHKKIHLKTCWIHLARWEFLAKFVQKFQKC